MSDFPAELIPWQKASLGAGIGSAISGAIEGIANSGINIYNSIKQNQLNREVFQYNKDLNTLQMQREDTAVQRRMKDLQQAGLNPLLAVSGNGASSSAGSQLSAPQVVSPTIATGVAEGLRTAEASFADAMQLKSLQATVQGQIIDNAIKTWTLENDMATKSAGLVLANEKKQADIDETKKQINLLDSKKKLTDSEKAYRDELVFRYNHDNKLLALSGAPSQVALGPMQTFYGKMGADFLRAGLHLSADAMENGLPGMGIINGTLLGLENLKNANTDAKFVNNLVEGVKENLKPKDSVGAKVWKKSLQGAYNFGKKIGNKIRRK